MHRVPLPRDPSLFPVVAGPVDLEIGCGVGFHPLVRSREYPERTVVAIERTKERFQRFSRRYENHGRPPNLVPVCADAVSWITHRVPERVLDTVFLLYPNPYPKPSQENKRWCRMPFMGFLLERLKTNAQLILASNSESYVREAQRSFQEDWGQEVVSVFRLGDEVQMKPRTHFEKKYLERGEACFQLEVRISRF